MPYKHEAALRERAEAYIQTLQAAGFNASIVPDSLRDYSVKVLVQQPPRTYGAVVLYYSEKNQQFTFKTHELKDKSAESQLLACWEQRLDATGSGQAPEPPLAGVAAYVDGSY